jgi:serine/threonine-protein kinase
LILYDMLVGRRRLVNETPMSELAHRMHQAPTSVESINPTIPGALAGVIAKCVQPDPEARYQKTADLAAALWRLDPLGQSTVQDSPTPVTMTAWTRALLRRPRPWHWAVAAGMVAAMSFGPRIAETFRSDRSSVAAEAATDRKRLAVLPFQVIGEAGAIEHVATGIREALSAKLFHLNQVTLTAGSAIDEARALASGSLERIGRELGVSLIVTATVTLIEGQLRVDVNLDDIDVDDVRLDMASFFSERTNSQA